MLDTSRDQKNTGREKLHEHHRRIKIDLAKRSSFPSRVRGYILRPDQEAEHL